MIHITYIISSIDKALEFEQVARKLDKKRFTLSFLLLNPNGSSLETFIQQQGIPVYRIYYAGKKNIPSSILRIYFLLRKIKPDIIHVHLFDASVAGLIAGKLAGIKRRISTRHHSDFHHTYFPHAVKYDKLINYLSTDIVAISDAVRYILVEQEGVHENKISIIPHGVEMELFDTIDEDNLIALKHKYNPFTKKPVIGVISRYIELKGIQFIIPAFKKLLVHYPDALLVLANAKGDYKDNIRQLLEDIPPENYVEIEFEKDICTLYRLFDIFVHVPTSLRGEAFGQIYIEALAAGIPSVFTLSGIAGSLIEHEKNALVVPYMNSDAIYNALLRFLKKDVNLDQMLSNGRQIVRDKFSVKSKIQLLEKLYLK